MRFVLHLAIAVLAGQASGQLPAQPPPRLPAYVSPADLVPGELPPGRVSVVVVEGRELVAYDKDAHTRLLVVLALGEKASTERARAAWVNGWIDATEALLPALDTERAARFEAEARAAAVESEGSSTPLLLSVAAGALAVGIAVGVWAGAGAGSGR